MLKCYFALQKGNTLIKFIVAQNTAEQRLRNRPTFHHNFFQAVFRARNVLSLYQQLSLLTILSIVSRSCM